MKSVFLLVAVAVLGVTGCTKRESTTTQTSAQRDSIAVAQGRLDRLRQEIDSLDVKAQNLGERARAEIQEEIRDLTVRRDSAAAQLDRLKSASREAWETTKEGTDRMLGALEGAIATARERIHSRADSVEVHTVTAGRKRR